MSTGLCSAGRFAAGLIATALMGCAPAHEPAAPGGRLIPTGVIFAPDETARAMPDGRALAAPYWTPAATEIAALEKLMAATFASMSNDRAYTISLNLPTYRRQYLGYSTGGRKLIFVNAFCREHWQRDAAWQTRLVEVDDGGPCFFRLHYDVAGDRFEDVQIHAEG